MKDAIRDTTKEIKVIARDAKDLESIFQQKQKDVKSL
jgi:chromosome segregation ATPase